MQKDAVVDLGCHKKEKHYSSAETGSEIIYLSMLKILVILYFTKLLLVFNFTCLLR